MKSTTLKRDTWCYVSLFQADYLQEASLLMAKLCYVEGEHRDALGNLHAPMVRFIYIYQQFAHTVMSAKGRTTSITQMCFTSL